MKVTIIYAPAARDVREWSLELDEGTTLSAALEASPIFHEFSALRHADLATGIWGQRAELTRALEENDRIEIYRPLRVDPKLARRERFNQQGSKGAGLFTNIRPGAKAGY